jgi:hypothetical protein
MSWLCAARTSSIARLSDEKKNSHQLSVEQWE